MTEAYEAMTTAQLEDNLQAERQFRAGLLDGSVHCSTAEQWGREYRLTVEAIDDIQATLADRALPSTRREARREGAASVL